MSVPVEQVSSDNRQISLAVGVRAGLGLGLGGPMSEVGWGQRGHCTVRSSAPWVMVTWNPSSRGQTE